MLLTVGAVLYGFFRLVVQLFRVRPPAKAARQLTEGDQVVGIAKGCGAIVGFGAIAAVVALVAGIMWLAHLPHDSDYQDVLTRDNVQTFVDHHKWSDSSWESGSETSNTVYAQKAIQRLGDAAYGKKFGDLMDDQKQFQATAYSRAHPSATTKPTVRRPYRPVAADFGVERNALSSYWQRVTNDFRELLDAYNGAAATATNDPAMASGMFGQLSGDAKGASFKVESMEVPDGLNLSDACGLGTPIMFQALADSADTMKTYLDSGKPSDLNDANSKKAQAVQYFEGCRGDVLQRFSEIGGVPTDVPDLSQ